MRESIFVDDQNKKALPKAYKSSIPITKYEKYKPNNRNIQFVKVKYIILVKAKIQAC